MIRFVNWFLKITAWLAQRIVFNIKLYYEDKSVQNRFIKGKAIIISNHTTVFDYAAMIFVFWSRTLRYQMAEVLYKKKPLKYLLKALGGIYVDRNAYNFSFIRKSEDILNKGGVVGIFPESRIPLPNEERPLEFKTSAAYIALSADAPIIPVYTNGSYFSLKRARIIIGKPIDVKELLDEQKDDKDNISYITTVLRQRVIELGKLMNEKCSK